LTRHAGWCTPGGGREKPEEGETLVTVEFLDRGGRTDVVLIHERFPNEAVRDRHESGWAGCLAKLATVVSDGAKP